MKPRRFMHMSTLQSVNLAAQNGLMMSRDWSLLLQPSSSLLHLMMAGRKIIKYTGRETLINF